MKHCSRRNVRKHKEIRGSDKYVTLDIYSKSDSMDKMKITSSESKGKLERSGKGLITSLGFKAKARPQKYNKARYAIRNVRKKDLSKIIREFEKFGKILYEKKRPKHDPTDCYFYPAKHLAKCMMISDTLNWHNYGGYTELTDPSSKGKSTDKDGSKCIIMHNTLSQNCSTNKGKSKRSIVNRTLSQSCYTNEGE